MVNYKQITVKMSVAETLDRIKTLLPRRGTLAGSYGECIEWLANSKMDVSEKNNELLAEIRRLKQSGKKQVRK